MNEMNNCIVQDVLRYIIQQCKRHWHKWFSRCTLVSSTNKTDRHDVTEILLKVALSTKTLTLILILISVLSRQGEEWHKHRSVVSKKMLKIKEVLDYCDEMDTVADDFMKHLMTRRNQHFEINDLEANIFKWAMECK